MQIEEKTLTRGGQIAGPGAAVGQCLFRSEQSLSFLMKRGVHRTSALGHCSSRGLVYANALYALRSFCFNELRGA